DRITELPLITEPVAGTEEVVRDAIAVAVLRAGGRLDVPGWLPLGELVGQVEWPEARELQADRKIGPGESEAVAAARVVTRVLEIQRERDATRINEAAGERCLLLAENGFAGSGQCLLWIEEGPQELRERLTAGGAAAEHHDAVGRKRPAGIRRLDREPGTGKLGISRCQLAVGQDDLVGVRHALDKDLVLPAESREWPVVRD